MTPLLSAGVNDRLEFGGEAISALAVAAERRLAPEHEAAQLLLCVVVGRLDSAKAPRCSRMCLHEPAMGHTRAGQKKELERVPCRRCVPPESVACDATVTSAVPFVHHELSSPEQCEPSRLAAAPRSV